MKPAQTSQLFALCAVLLSILFRPALAQEHVLVLPDTEFADSGYGITKDLSVIPTWETQPRESTLIPPHERAVLSDAAYRVAGSNNRFALDIYKSLSHSSDAAENLLVSPFSISTALAMTYAGARGETATQMANVLHFFDQPSESLHPAYGELLGDLKGSREGYQLNVANRLFGQASYAFKNEFLDLVAKDYSAPLEELDFYADAEVARVHINDWVEGETNQRIKNLLPQGSVTQDTRLVLTNAIHFDGQWKHKFLEEATRDVSFFRADGAQETVSMMFQQESFNYAELDGFQMLEMPYAGDDLSMVVMLPEDVDGLSGLEHSLTPAMLDESLAALRQREVRVSLPKFTFDDSFTLSSALAELGMGNAFGSQADFTGIADAGLSISDVLHKTFIDVNEEGTEAAAATGVIIGVTSVVWNPPPVEFRADRPFLFALRDTHSGSLLFLGRVTEPSKLAGSASVPEPTAAVLVMLAIVAGAASSRPQRS